MNNKGKEKTKPWRIIVSMISIVFISYVWVKKDIVSVYSTMPKEQIVPLIAITIGVSLIKVIAIAGVFFLIKLVIIKTRRDKSK